MVLEYDAWAIGRGAEKVKDVLEAEYRRDLSLEEAIELSLKALVNSVERIDEKWTARVATIPVSTKKYSMMPQEELMERLKPLIEAREKG